MVAAGLRLKTWAFKVKCKTNTHFWVDTRVTRRVLQCDADQDGTHHSVAVRRPLAYGAVAAVEQDTRILRFSIVSQL